MTTLSKSTLPVVLYQNKNSKSAAFQKWYARVDNSRYGVMDLEALSAHIAHHGSIFTASVVLGVMRQMVSCVQELCLEGRKVKFDNLGIFTCQVSNQKGADTKTEWKASNIKGIKLAFRPNRAGVNSFERSVLRDQVAISCHGVTLERTTTETSE